MYGKRSRKSVGSDVEVVVEVIAELLAVHVDDPPRRRRHGAPHGWHPARAARDSGNSDVGLKIGLEYQTFFLAQF